MKTMKKAISLLMAATLVATMFVGCKSLPTITVTSTADLSGKKIGVQAGTTGETWVSLPENVTSKPDDIVSFKSGMDAAMALKNGSIDLVVLDQLPAESIVKKNTSLQILDLTLGEPEEYAIAVKKGNTELVNTINAAIDGMKANGDYEALVAAFMPTDGKIVIPADLELAGDKMLKMGTNAAFAPFEYAEGDKIVGFDITMAQNIAKQAGTKLTVVDMEFNSLISALTAGTIDFVAAGMSVTEERLKNVDFSNPYYASQQVVISRK